MRHEFIDGAASSSTYLIIGRRKGDNLRLAIRRLARHGEKAVYRIHVYPTMRDFGLDAPEDTTNVFYHAQREDYETLHMRGDAEVRDYLLPALAARGVESLEYDSAIAALKAHSPGDNNPAAYSPGDNTDYDPAAIGIGAEYGSDTPTPEPKGIGHDGESEGLGSLGGDENPEPDNSVDPDEL